MSVTKSVIIEMKAHSIVQGTVLGISCFYFFKSSQIARLSYVQTFSIIPNFLLCFYLQLKQYVSIAPSHIVSYSATPTLLVSLSIDCLAKPHSPVLKGSLCASADAAYSFNSLKFHISEVVLVATSIYYSVNKCTFIGQSLELLF